jgi:hypothetical protein
VIIDAVPTSTVTICGVIASLGGFATSSLISTPTSSGSLGSGNASTNPLVSNTGITSKGAFVDRWVLGVFVSLVAISIMLL